MEAQKGEKKITYRYLKEIGFHKDQKNITIPKNYSATIPEFIKKYRYKVDYPEDMISPVSEKMTLKDARLYAIWCIRYILNNPNNLQSEHINHHRAILNKCDVSEKYINGEVTEEEFIIAWDGEDEVDACFKWQNIHEASIEAALDLDHIDAFIDHLFTYFE